MAENGEEDLPFRSQISIYDTGYAYSIDGL